MSEQRPNGRYGYATRAARNGAIALFLAAFTLMLVRLWGNGFTSGDEGFTAVARFRYGGVWEAAMGMATGHGRFYHLVVYPLAQLPYLFDSLAVVNTFRIVSSGSAILMYVLFARELFGVRTALLSGFIFCGLFDTVGGSYNPFHGLPLWFNAGAAVLFLSLWLFVRRCRQGASLHLPYVVLFVALLFYESMLFYAPAYVPLYFALWPQDTHGSLAQTVRVAAARNIGLFAAVGGYLLLYAAFRAFFPSSYVGAAGLSLGPVDEIARTIVVFSLNGVYVPSEWASVDRLSFLPLVYTLVVTAGAVLSLRLGEEPREKLDHVILWLLGLCVFVFTPNLLYGFTERYRDFVVSHEAFYIGSYYSAFALCLLAAVAATQWFIRYWQGLFGKLVVAAGFCAYALLSYANQLQSVHFFSASRNDSLRWVVANQLAEMLREKHPTASRLCTATFINGVDVYDYWSLHLSNLVKRQIRVRYETGMDPECDLHMDYERKGRVASLTLRTAGGDNVSTFTAHR